MRDLRFIKYQSGNAAVSAEENDIEPGVLGDVDYVEGHDRKLQDLVKILETAIGSNPIFTTYGSTLPLAVGRRDAETDDYIRDGIISAVSFLVEMETSPEPSERISGIKSLTIEKGSEAGSRVVTLVVTLKDGSEISLTKEV